MVYCHTNPVVFLSSALTDPYCLAFWWPEDLWEACGVLELSILRLKLENYSLEDGLQHCRRFQLTGIELDTSTTFSLVCNRRLCASGWHFWYYMKWWGQCKSKNAPYVLSMIPGWQQKSASCLENESSNGQSLCLLYLLCWKQEKSIKTRSPKIPGGINPPPKWTVDYWYTSLPFFPSCPKHLWQEFFWGVISPQHFVFSNTFLLLEQFPDVLQSCAFIWVATLGCPVAQASSSVLAKALELPISHFSPQIASRLFFVLFHPATSRQNLKGEHSPDLFVHKHLILLRPDPRECPILFLFSSDLLALLLLREVPTSFLNGCPINNKLPSDSQAGILKFHLYLQLQFRDKKE